MTRSHRERVQEYWRDRRAENQRRRRRRLPVSRTRGRRIHARFDIPNLRRNWHERSHWRASRVTFPSHRYVRQASMAANRFAVSRYWSNGRYRRRIEQSHARFGHRYRYRRRRY